ASSLARRGAPLLHLFDLQLLTSHFSLLTDHCCPLPFAALFLQNSWVQPILFSLDALAREIRSIVIGVDDLCPAFRGSSVRRGRWHQFRGGSSHAFRSSRGNC